MTEQRVTQDGPVPDLDLCEYVIVTAPSVAALNTVAAAIAALVGDGSVRLLDTAVLERAPGTTTVLTHEAASLPDLAALAQTVAGDDAAGFSQHDLELAGLTLSPGTAALLLLLEDRWAEGLAAALGGVGGRILSGERIGRNRLRTHLERRTDVQVTPRDTRSDLLARGPSDDSLPGRQLVDPTDQIRKLARLVDDGVLSLEQYDVQRRLIIDG